MIPKQKRAVLNKTQRQISHKIHKVKEYMNRKVGTNYNVNKYEHYKMKLSALEYLKNNSADYRKI